MYAEADEQPGDGVHGIVVAVSLMGVMGVVVFMRLGLFFAAGTVVVAMFGPASELFQQQLDEESHHDRGGNLEMDAGCDETVGVVAEEDVGDEVDEAGGEEESAAEDGDVRGEFWADMFAAGYQSDPEDDARYDECVG